jgi:hypothetical protein
MPTNKPHRQEQKPPADSSYFFPFLSIIYFTCLGCTTRSKDFTDPSNKRRSPCPLKNPILIQRGPNETSSFRSDTLIITAPYTDRHKDFTNILKSAYSVNKKMRGLVIPQLCCKTSPQETGWSLRRKLGAAPLGDGARSRYP